MIWPTITKIEKEAEKALIIVPMWPTQTWFTPALELATATPIIIENRHLCLPGSSKQHPLCPKLKLMAICCSNKHQQIEFRKQLAKSSLRPAHRRLNPSTNQYSKKWEEFCGERSISTMETDEINVIQFLTEYERGLSFNYLRVYISALKNYLPSQILDGNVVKKFKKCIFKPRPLKTKYHAIWDVNILLNVLENMSTDSDMDVSRKLVVCSC